MITAVFLFVKQHLESGKIQHLAVVADKKGCLIKRLAAGHADAVVGHSIDNIAVFNRGVHAFLAVNAEVLLCLLASPIVGAAAVLIAE